MRVWLAFLVGLFLASGSALGDGAAPDPDLPAADPPGFWRRITQEDATTTSQCIGRVDSVLCSLETMVAGLVRKDSSLCAAASQKPESAWKFHSEREPGYEELVRIESAERFQINNIPPHRAGWDLQPGDVAVFIQVRVCRQGACQEDAPNTVAFSLEFVNSDAVQKTRNPNQEFRGLIPDIMVFRKESGGWRFKGIDSLVPGDKPPFQ